MPNLFKRHPKRQGRHTPDLWPVGWVALLALLIVGLLACGLFVGADALLTAKTASQKPVSVQDVIKTTITVLTLIGAVLAALYAYRKQLLEEGASTRADETQLAERYAKAAEQLGHDQAAVRLAGVYTMARLADDWPEQRKVCVDVLCAYLRMPYESDPAGAEYMKGEKEVRLTIIRTIRDHLQDPAASTTWCGLDLDFTGADFDGGDFSGATFSGGTVTFSHATFERSAVIFSGATFSGSTVTFYRARFLMSEVYFSDATFSGGTVTFYGASFSGSGPYFSDATFSGGTVAFYGASFSGGAVTFHGATFSGGTVAFESVAFSSTTLTCTNTTFSGGEVSFEGHGARFQDGAIFFGGATFSGGRVAFKNVTFSDNEIDFYGARFLGGEVFFSRVTFSGSVEASFSHATFSAGDIDFSNTTFVSGDIDFTDATLTGSTVRFTDVLIHSAATIDWGPFPEIAANRP
ncbi:pentapeptide repeat-containing protein [Streptomyces avermitilis]|uniref:pentapeptide repeat-containing protein n=1 Tax=Streptomyces avermitilis TaxID=33903 RepID=UPI0033BFD4CD